MIELYKPPASIQTNKATPCEPLVSGHFNIDEWSCRKKNSAATKHVQSITAAEAKKWKMLCSNVSSSCLTRLQALSRLVRETLSQMNHSSMEVAFCRRQSRRTVDRAAALPAREPTGRPGSASGMSKSISRPEIAGPCRSGHAGNSAVACRSLPNTGGATLPASPDACPDRIDACSWSREISLRSWLSQRPAFCSPTVAQP
mmetsp:Transcript_95267/g.188795  ORF Transcript_95267/g.188795 Transcript_95267/m.188795 type:complete len:201 (-) Transcript_95267:124-726(-)